MRMQPAAHAKFHICTDDAIRADFAIRANLRVRVNNRGRMNTRRSHS